MYTFTNYNMIITERKSKRNGKMVFEYVSDLKVIYNDHLLFINISRVDESGITIASHCVSAEK